MKCSCKKMNTCCSLEAVKAHLMYEYCKQTWGDQNQNMLGRVKSWRTTFNQGGCNILGSSAEFNFSLQPTAGQILSMFPSRSIL